MVISRFKKGALCTGLLVLFAASTAVATSVKIINATPIEVKSYILTNRALRHPNSTVSLIPNYGSSLQMGSVVVMKRLCLSLQKNLELDYLVNHR